MFDFHKFNLEFYRIFHLVCLLMDHQEQQTEAKRRRYKRVSDLIRITWRFARDFTEEEVIRVLGILSVNSFCVHDGVEDGTGLIGKAKYHLNVQQSFGHID